MIIGARNNNGQQGLWTYPAVSLLLAVFLFVAIQPAHATPGWNDIDQLIKNRKISSASKQLDEIIKAARRQNNHQNWRQALLLASAMRYQKGQVETAVNFLMEQDWPRDKDSQLLLNLYLARLLNEYVSRYQWEIQQREKISTKKRTPLKKKTLGQLQGEINQAYSKAYKLARERGARANDPIQNFGGLSLPSLKNLFVSSDYPKNVRGGVLDTVTYLWVESLANSALWTPAQSNEQLPLKQLLTFSQVALQRIKLDDSQIHPFKRMVKLLTELEYFERSQRRPEAALEAFREKIHQLQDYRRNNPPFRLNEADRELLIQALRTKLKQSGVASLHWSNMLRLELARLLKDDNVADANIQAMAVLKQCVASFKKQRPASWCRYEMETLLAPQMQLSSMKIDGLGKRSLQLSHKNIDTVYFRAWRIPLNEALKLNHYEKIRQLISGNRAPDASWQQRLPQSRDYKTHISYVTPPFKRLGYWFIAASQKADFKLNDKKNLIASSSLNLSRLVIDSRSTDKELQLTVYQGESGRLAGKVRVELWKSGFKTAQRIAARQTGGDGRVSFPNKGQQNKIVARYDNDFVIMENPISAYFPRQNAFLKSTLIFTDRAIYRPGQTIKWKVVAYAGNRDTGKYKTLPHSPGWVQLLDANGRQVIKTKVKTNDYGSASGEFIAKTGLRLGQWRIKTSWANRGYSPGQSIKVEEYKRPTFSAKIEKSKVGLRLNKPAVLTGSAHYYFGQPVTGGKVKWRIERRISRVHPYWGYVMPLGDKETIKSGNAELDSKGQFRIRFTPRGKAASSNETFNYRFTLVADIIDSGGETRSASRSFAVGEIGVQANLDNQRAYFSAGKPQKLEIYRHDLNDAPLAGAASWRLMRVQQPAHAPLPAELPASIDQRAQIKVRTAAKYQTPGDKLSPRWRSMPDIQQIVKNWKDAGLAEQGVLKHDDAGMATLKLGPLAAGVYRLYYVTKDRWGKPFRLTRMIIVGGERPAPIKLPLLLQAQSKAVEAGDKIRLLVGSGFVDTPVLLEIYQGNKLLKRSFQRGGVKQFEYPVSRANRGSLTFVATLIRNYQLIRLTEEVRVPWTDKNLNVSFSTFRDKLRPGQKETWRVTVRDAKNRPLEKGAVEVLASMFDKSLEFFGKHNPPALDGLYLSQNPHYVRETSCLGFSHGQFYQGYEITADYPGDFQPVRLQLIGSGPQQLEAAVPVVAAPAPRRNYRPAPRAAQRVEVYALQRKLRASAYYKGPIDGVVGQDVRDKLKRFMNSTADDSSLRAIADDAGLQSVKIRKNFNETAFFYPQLLLDNNGSVAFEFEVPESLTEWKVWAAAISKDLRGGSAVKFARTSKELMVRPYLPRFLRAGDQAQIEVVVNNASPKALSGRLEFDVIDPDSKQSITSAFRLVNGRRDFQVAPGKSSRLRFSLVAPQQLGLVAIRARARAFGGAQSFADGEQRPLPILPSRIHLSQSRFAALSGKGQGQSTRALVFDELAHKTDNSRINVSLVVTVDGQLFYSVLKALPYLTDYPYECTEQTMNRFLSTSIIASVFDKNPALMSLAGKFAQRKSRLQQWFAVDQDPNHKMLLEETPWLQDAEGASQTEDKLIRVLDPVVARTQRQSALKKLLKTQTASGGFPWWQGGRPSPYMTVYLLQGFSRALEFGGSAPKSNVQRAWKYLHQHYRDKLKPEPELGKNPDIQFMTLLNYVLSAYPDNSWSGGVFSSRERKAMLDLSYKHWRKLSLMTRAYLALTLKRAGRLRQARQVFDSIMDLAKTDKDLGTYFAPEDRSWLWYNDRVDSHAFILRALMEINPSDKRRHGLAQWLMLNKKLNHWKSTRATAEAIYALVHYLQREGGLGKEQRAAIRIGKSLSKQLLFTPDKYSGAHNQLVVDGDNITPDMGTISVSNQGNSLMFASATWHFSTEKLPKSAQGDFFSVTRRFYRRVQKGKQKVLQPLTEGAVIKVGDELEAQLSLRVRHSAEFVHLRAPRGAGFEPLTQTSAHHWQNGIGYYEEIRDSGANYFFDRLPAGEYSFKYRLRATTAGRFRVAPAMVQSIYAPEFNAYSSGKRLMIR